MLSFVSLAMTSSESVVCFYCSEYAKVAKDYPKNFASNDEGSFTPRCHLHWKFECSKCGNITHFNGMTWCSDCKTFTCINCAEEKMVREEFLVYDYYYNIPCHKCGKHNPALDFAEYDGTHPYQLGDLRPDEDIDVWFPVKGSDFEDQIFPHSAWGCERIVSLGKRPEFKRLDSLDEYNPKSTWDAMAPHWLTVEEENYHHKYRILPDVYRMLDIQKDEEILDVACGKGDVARHLARSGAKVTGIDISKMLDYAIESEEEEKLGIIYLKLNAEKLSTKYGKESFDKVVCNMALMDIDDYRTTIQQISHVLKENGVFVFSILHPAFSFPATMGIKVPHDSDRNEDRIRVIIDYFDERPVLFDFGGRMFPSPCFALHFQRPLSSYLNELVRNNLVLREMSEPKVSEELVRQFPRNAYWDDERRPEFLIVKASKKSDLQ
jgi:2-polyprenyl-3-methyl-5-hydroxy-6-metoxy-1,4-benzoquinol methylase